jgi:hypothetical protein
LTLEFVFEEDVQKGQGKQHSGKEMHYEIPLAIEIGCRNI